ncbi:hypothetical protein BDY21DRAFT_349916 [Lineolata rhizophorae]|uniref:Uncharacterized protein n=1 Tax=Lineolata rhizophorae TaxID=578093 RepID=A0A6A6NWK8_9PEZI|nr:hypothetical protein BDY21DRAFT_349916 [Lineolata rhizophorae]
MLDFMYEGDYNDCKGIQAAKQPSATSLDGRLMRSIVVSSMAYLYNVPKPRELARGKARVVIRQRFAPNEFFAALDEAYKWGDKDMHKMLALEVHRNIHKLVKTPAFRNVREVSDFAYFIIQYLCAQNRRHSERHELVLKNAKDFFSEHCQFEVSSLPQFLLSVPAHWQAQDGIRSRWIEFLCFLRFLRVPISALRLA